MLSSVSYGLPVIDNNISPGLSNANKHVDIA